MAEYSANALQTVATNASVIFTETPVPNANGLIFHRDESGIFRLASPTRIAGGAWNWGCCSCAQMPEAVYQVAFHANIAIPEGGTVAPISLGIAIDGTVDPSSTMISTPAAAEEFNNIGAEILVAVPAICGCESVTVVNTGSDPVDVQNANLIITFLGIKS